MANPYCAREYINNASTAEINLIRRKIGRHCEATVEYPSYDYLGTSDGEIRIYDNYSEDPNQWKWRKPETQEELLAALKELVLKQHKLLFHPHTGAAHKLERKDDDL